MKNKKTSLVIFIFISVLMLNCSENNNDKIDRKHDCYPNGALRLLVNAKQDSSSTVVHFYENGNIKEICNYDRNKKEKGLLCKFDSLGNITEIGYYKEGLEEGVSYLFEDRVLDFEMKYNMRKHNGRSCLYRKDGTIRGAKYFKDDILYKCQRNDSIGYIFLESEFIENEKIDYIYLGQKKVLFDKLNPSKEDSIELKMKYDYLNQNYLSFPSCDR